MLYCEYHLYGLKVNAKLKLMTTREACNAIEA